MKWICNGIAAQSDLLIRAENNPKSVYYDLIFRVSSDTGMLYHAVLLANAEDEVCSTFRIFEVPGALYPD